MPIPCFINNRNLVTMPRAMLADLRRIGCEPIIVDNASTAPDVRAWYDTNPCQIIRLPHNVGKFAPWESGAVQRYATDYYIVTDPDLDLSSVPDDVLTVLRTGMDRHNAAKCGLSLRIDDIPADTVVGAEAVHWERTWWQNSADSQFFNAAIDTTFAMYLKHRQDGPQLRAKPPYTARHLPWYYTTANMPEEYRYYLSEASSVSDWGNKMKRVFRDTNEKLSGRYVTFTFDDGDIETAREVDRIMATEHATFYIVPGWINEQHPETMDEYNRKVKHGGDWDWRALAYHGHDIGSHTMTHCVPNSPNAQNEYAQSLEYIKRFGVGPYSLSMPWHMDGPVDAPYDSIRCGNSVKWNPLDVDLRRVGSWTVYPEKMGEITKTLRDAPGDCWTVLCMHGLQGRLAVPWNREDFMLLLDTFRVLNFQVRSMAEMTTLKRSAARAAK